MLEGRLQETTARHHREDMRTRTTPEALHLRHEAMTRTLEQIHMLDRAALLLLEAMAATAVAATEGTTIGHTSRMVRSNPTQHGVGLMTTA